MELLNGNGCVNLLLVECPEIVRLIGLAGKVAVHMRGVDIESDGSPSMIYKLTPVTE